MTARISRRHALLGGAGVALGAIGFGGCARGPGGAEEGSFDQVGSTVPSKYEHRQVIVAWHSFGGHNGEVMMALADKFNQSQSDIYLDMQFQGGYDTTLEKLTGALQSGSSPDLVTVSEGSQGKLELQQIAQPMNEFFSADELSRFNEVMLSQWTVGEEVTQIPFARSTPLFYFNRDLYAKIGLPDRAPKTWKEFSEWGAEIHQHKDPHGDPMLMMAVDTSAWEYQGYVWQFGGKLSDGLDLKLNQDGAVDAAEFLRGLCRKKYMSVVSQDTFNNAFSAGGMYSTASIANITKTAKFRVGVGFMPAGKERACPTGGSGFTMPKGINRSNKEAGAQVLKFLAEPDNAAYWTISTGYVPIVDDAAKSEVFEKKAREDPNYLVAIDQLKYARATDPVRSFVPGAGSISEQYISLLYQSDDPVQPLLDRWANALGRSADNVRPQYEDLFGA